MHIHFFLQSYSLTVAKALRPSGGETELCPEKLPDILLLSNDPRPDAPYMLANTLWFHYHKSPNWAWSIWDNTFAALRVQVNAEASRDTRYATFLLHVDQHLPGGLDEHVARWFQETGKAELISIDSVAWMSLTHTLLHLVVQGVLATTTILKGLVYPLWSHALMPRERPTARYISAPPTTSSRASYYRGKTGTATWWSCNACVHGVRTSSTRRTSHCSWAPSQRLFSWSTHSTSQPTCDPVPLRFATRYAAPSSSAKAYIEI
jgi:hypothetical protein